ncbi:hypothetical protein GCM10010440_48810 [Kitasatospora cinereorecta]
MVLGQFAGAERRVGGAQQLRGQGGRVGDRVVHPDAVEGQRALAVREGPPDRPGQQPPGRVLRDPGVGGPVAAVREEAPVAVGVGPADGLGDGTGQDPVEVGLDGGAEEQHGLRNGREASPPPQRTATLTGYVLTRQQMITAARVRRPGPGSAPAG